MPDEQAVVSATPPAPKSTLSILSLILSLIALIAAGASLFIMLGVKKGVEILTETLGTNFAQVSEIQIDHLKRINALEEKLSTTKETVEAVTDDQTIVEETDYRYDSSTGNITSVKDGNVVYTYEVPDTYPEDYMSVQILGQEGSKLILNDSVGVVSVDFSPGPGWIYELWLSDKLEYIDLNDPSQGPMPYTVPEWKKQEAQEQLDELERSWE